MSEFVRAAPPSRGLLAAVTLLKRLFDTFEGHLAMQLAACALEFESGEIGVHQLLASKRATDEAALPLTRRHLYPTTTPFEGQAS